MIKDMYILSPQIKRWGRVKSEFTAKMLSHITLEEHKKIIDNIFRIIERFDGIIDHIDEIIDRFMDNYSLFNG